MKKNNAQLLAIMMISLGFAACQSSSGSSPAEDPVVIDDPGVTPDPGTYVWTYEDSAVSGIPVTKDVGVSVPSGNGCNLKILNWAGFSGAASYTFDDTQPSQIAHWSEIKATGVRTTFFAVSSYTWVVNRDSVLIDAVKNGYEIGNHTATHVKVSQCASASAAAAELDTCNAYITGLGQKAVWSMAFPEGDTAWAAKLAGKFLLGRSVNYGFVAPNDGTDPLCLPTWCIDSTHDIDDFKSQLNNCANQKEWLIFVYHSLLPTSDNWYAGVPVKDVADSLTYGKETGKIWIDSMVNVGSYWIGQKLVTKLSPAADGSGYTWNWTLPAGYPAGKYLRVVVDGGKLSQNGTALSWNTHGFYEVSMDAGALSWQP